MSDSEPESKMKPLNNDSLADKTPRAGVSGLIEEAEILMSEPDQVKTSRQYRNESKMTDD